MKCDAQVQINKILFQLLKVNKEQFKFFPFQTIRLLTLPFHKQTTEIKRRRESLRTCLSMKTTKEHIANQNSSLLFRELLFLHRSFQQ